MAPYEATMGRAAPQPITHFFGPLTSSGPSVAAAAAPAAAASPSFVSEAGVRSAATAHPSPAKAPALPAVRGAQQKDQQQRRRPEEAAAQALAGGAPTAGAMPAAKRLRTADLIPHQACGAMKGVSVFATMQAGTSAPGRHVHSGSAPGFEAAAPEAVLLPAPTVTAPRGVAQPHVQLRNPLAGQELGPNGPMHQQQQRQQRQHQHQQRGAMQQVGGGGVQPRRIRLTEALALLAQVPQPSQLPSQPAQPLQQATEGGGAQGTGEMVMGEADEGGGVSSAEHCQSVMAQNAEAWLRGRLGELLGDGAGAALCVLREPS